MTMMTMTKIDKLNDNGKIMNSTPTIILLDKVPVGLELD